MTETNSTTPTPAVIPPRDGKLDERGVVVPGSADCPICGGAVDTELDRPMQFVETSETLPGEVWCRCCGDVHDREFVEAKVADSCERCGVEDTSDPFDGTAHSPLCQGETGQFTHLTDDQVRDTLQMIDRCDGQVVRKPFPLDPDIDPRPF